MQAGSGNGGVLFHLREEAEFQVDRLQYISNRKTVKWPHACLRDWGCIVGVLIAKSSVRLLSPFVAFVGDLPKLRLTAFLLSSDTSPCYVFCGCHSQVLDGSPDKFTRNLE